MKIYKSLKNSIITQGFGIEKTNPSVLHFYKELGMLAHNGWDWTAKDRDKIYFDVSCKGKVINITTDLNAGYGIEILTEDKDGIFKHRYWHLKTDGILVKIGQEVESGDLIGLADNTGKYSTGSHLHRDLKQCSYQTNGKMEVINYNNGYFGAIDITPYFTNIFVVDFVDTLKVQIGIIQKLIELFKQLFKK